MCIRVIHLIWHTLHLYEHIQTQGVYQRSQIIYMFVFLKKKIDQACVFVNISLQLNSVELTENQLFFSF